MIRSMTAFAQAEVTTETRTITVEIRSYNSRYLDAIIRIPQVLQPLEEKIRGIVSNRISRGRVEVKLQFHDHEETPCTFEVDTARADGYMAALSELRTRFGFTDPIALDDLVRISGVIRPAENHPGAEVFMPAVEQCLNSALNDLEAMRLTEGKFLRIDFEQRLTTIEGVIDRIAAMSDGLVPIYKERLTERISRLTDGSVDIDPSRIAQETALLADRSDISEEIVRARSHVAQFRSVMNGDEPSGRKLNFLLQEFNREFNTIGSKASQSEISHLVVDLKTEIEKIREQVQNIE